MPSAQTGATLSDHASEVGSADWATRLLLLPPGGCFRCGADVRSSRAASSSLCDVACGCRRPKGSKGLPPCPARYCGDECRRANLEERHDVFCRPMREAMAGVSLETCEESMASELSVIVAYLLRVREALPSLEKNGKECPADMISLSPHILAVRCLTGVRKASKGMSSSEQDSIAAHLQHLLLRIVFAYLESLITSVEEETQEKVVWSKGSQREVLQLLVAVRQLGLDGSFSCLANACIAFLEIACDIALDQRQRAACKLVDMYTLCNSFDTLESHWASGHELASTKSGYHILNSCAMLSEYAARLAHELAASQAKAILQASGSSAGGQVHEFPLSQIFAWQPRAMPAAAASAALPGLELAEKWSRRALQCDRQLLTLAGHGAAAALVSSSQVRCSGFAARHALASFVSSFDSQRLGRSVFGLSGVLDLLYKALRGSESPDTLEADAALAATDLLAGFSSILQQIARAINRRKPGTRWLLVHRSDDDMEEFVYIDGEASPFMRDGCVAVVLYDSAADALLSEERERSSACAPAASAADKANALVRKYVDVRGLLPLERADQQVVAGDLRGSALEALD